jgi:hypothetical protein
METLNVRAGSHATYGLDNIDSPQKIITPISSSQVSLLVNDITITSHYSTQLRKAATRPAMLQRFKKQHQWSEQTFDSVDWKAHHGMLQKMCKISNFIHQLLPMGDIFHKIDPSQSATCSS